MKKFMFAMFVMLVIAMGTVTAGAASSNVGLVVNGNIIADGVFQSVEIVNGTTLVPIRTVSDNLACQVTWHDKTKTIVINSYPLNLMEYGYSYNSVIMMQMKIGDKNAYVGVDHSEYKTSKLAVPPTIVRDRAYVPVRFIAEALFCNVEFLKDPITGRNYVAISSRGYANSQMGLTPGMSLDGVDTTYVAPEPLTGIEKAYANFWEINELSAQEKEYFDKLNNYVSQYPGIKFWDDNFAHSYPTIWATRYEYDETIGSDAKVGFNVADKTDDFGRKVSGKDPKYIGTFYAFGGIRTSATDATGGFDPEKDYHTTYYDYYPEELPELRYPTSDVYIEMDNGNFNPSPSRTASKGAFMTVINSYEVTPDMKSKDDLPGMIPGTGGETFIPGVIVFKVREPSDADKVPLVYLDKFPTGEYGFYDYVFEPINIKLFKDM
jgi:hypothetical protein